MFNCPTCGKEPHKCRCYNHQELNRLRQENEMLKDDILVLQTRIRCDGDLFDYLKQEIKRREEAVKALAEEEDQ